MIVYISGAITGQETFAKLLFEVTEDQLREQGHNPINPFNICIGVDSGKWEDYMDVCLSALIRCDAIFMLSNWGTSRGARIEYAIAREMGLTIIHEKDNAPISKAEKLNNQ